MFGNETHSQLLTHHTFQSGVQTVTLALVLDQTRRQRRLIIVSVFFPVLTGNISSVRHHSAVADKSDPPGKYWTHIRSPYSMLMPQTLDDIILTDNRDHHREKKLFEAKYQYFGSDIVYLLNRWRRERDQPICLWWVNTPFSPTLRWLWCIVRITAKVTILAICSPTSADYESLRIGGLGFAVVLFILGILLILSEFTCLCSYVLLFCSPTFMVITSDCDSDVYFVVL